MCHLPQSSDHGSCFTPRDGAGKVWGRGDGLMLCRVAVSILMYPRSLHLYELKLVEGGACLSGSSGLMRQRECSVAAQPFWPWAPRFRSGP